MALGLPDRQERSAAVLVTEADGELRVEAEGVGACPGDSGGPALVTLRKDDRSVVRVAAIISTGAAGCEQGSVTLEVVGPFVSWIEARTGLDLSPCGGPDGAWSPTPACSCRSTQPEVCVWDFCGPATTVEVRGDHDAPTIALALGSSSDQGYLDPSVTATDDGSGVQEVRLEVRTADGHRFADAIRSLTPYDFPSLALGTGRYTIVASAVDYAGNAARTSRSLDVQAAGSTCTVSFGSCGADSLKMAGLFPLVLILLIRARRRRGGNDEAQ